MKKEFIRKEMTKGIFNLSIPVPAIDIVIFTIYKDKFCILLTKKSDDPFKWKFVLPGGILMSGYSLEENFDRILLEKTGIKWVYKEQLYTFWDPDRDTRWHAISIIYYALVRNESFLQDIDLTKVHIIEYDSLNFKDVGFDHEKIIKYAKQRLDWKLEYTNISKNILPDYFTLSNLQKVYEIILGKTIDKRNFRKKILSTKILKDTWTQDKSSNRPARLYEFIDKDLKIMDIL